MILFLDLFPLKQLYYVIYSHEKLISYSFLVNNSLGQNYWRYIMFTYRRPLARR